MAGTRRSSTSTASSRIGPGQNIARGLSTCRSFETTSQATPSNGIPLSHTSLQKLSKSSCRNPTLQAPSRRDEGTAHEAWRTALPSKRWRPHVGEPRLDRRAVGILTVYTSLSHRSPNLQVAGSACDSLLRAVAYQTYIMLYIFSHVHHARRTAKPLYSFALWTFFYLHHSLEPPGFMEPCITHEGYR
jgi:hypothetical protein